MIEAHKTGGRRPGFLSTEEREEGRNLEGQVGQVVAPGLELGN